jgi:hypothetical protein
LNRLLNEKKITAISALKTILAFLWWERFLYSAMMTPQHITALLERTPFVPFRIHLTNGQTFDVKHPDFVWVFRSRLELAVPSTDEQKIMDRAEHISLLHITRIEELPVLTGS